MLVCSKGMMSNQTSSVAITSERPPNGFSLVELLVVTVFLAALAAVAVNRYPSVIEWARLGSVKSDLRHALQVEEERFANHQEYVAFSVGPGGSVVDPPFQASTGVSVTATVSQGKLKIVGFHVGSTRSLCISTSSHGVVEGVDC